MSTAGKPRFYQQTRMKVVLTIAGIEALVIWLKKDITWWTAIIIAIPIILFYLLAGRSLESRLGREISWVLATSQALAVIAVILVLILKPLALILAAAFAAVALFLLFQDKPRHGESTRLPK